MLSMSYGPARRTAHEFGKQSIQYNVNRIFRFQGQGKGNDFRRSCLHICNLVRFSRNFYEAFWTHHGTNLASSFKILTLRTYQMPKLLAEKVKIHDDLLYKWRLNCTRKLWKLQYVILVVSHNVFLKLHFWRKSKNESPIAILLRTHSLVHETWISTKLLCVWDAALRFVWAYAGLHSLTQCWISLPSFPWLFHCMKEIAFLFSLLVMKESNKKRAKVLLASSILTTKALRRETICLSAVSYQISLK